jgi:hypothetical protein
VPFLYYLVFLVMLVTGFVANAFLREGDTQSVAAVGRVTTDTTPLEKLQREISIRRGVIPPQQEEHIDAKISPAAPIAVQTEAAAAVPEKLVSNSARADEVSTESSGVVGIAPEPVAPAKRARRKEASKCGPGGCEAKPARSVWSNTDQLP